MAQSYERRINLFINIDGKEISNNVKSINSELSKLVNQQKLMTIGSKEYIEAQGKIKQLRGILDEHRQGLANVQSPMQKLIGTAKGLLPAFGFAALGGLAKQAFGAIISATDALGTKWDIFIGGLKGGLNELWRTIAAGDWNNFFTNMSEAIRVGREYQSMLDTIEEKTRALRMVEANSNREALELEVKLRNQTLSKEERLAAGQERIKLEEKLSKERVKIAQDEFDSELMLAEQQTRLSKERLMEILSDIDSEKKAQAQKYNEILEQYESAVKKSEMVKPGLARAGITENPFSKDVESTKAQLDSFPDSVKVYAESIRGMGKTTDEQLNKVVEKYEKLKAAENSSLENTKRVTTMVNSLLSQKDTGSNKTIEERKNKEYAAQLKLLDAANTEINDRLIDQYNIQGWTEERFKFQQLLAEQSYLEEKKKLQLKWGQDTVAIDGQINDNRLKLKEQYYALVTERDNEFLGQVDESTKTEAQLLADSIDATSNSIDESFKKVDLAADKEKETLEKRAQTYKMVSDTIVSSLSEALSGSLDEYATYGDSLILMALQILKQMAPIWAAQIVGGSLATPDSILTGGLAGIAKFTAILAIMYGFIGAAEKSVKTKIANRKEAAATENSYASGGFTDGDRIYRAGEAGTEWIMPAWMVKNPQMGQMVAGLEEMRRKRVVVKPEILAWTNIQGFAKGGYTSSFSAEAAGLDGSPLEGLLTIFGGGKGMTDKKQNKLLRRMAATLDGFGTSVTGITNGGSNSNFSQQAANLNGSSLEGLLSIFGGAKGVMDQKQNKLLERMAATLDRIERKDPTVSVEMYEKKSAIFNKITNSGLK